MTALNGSLQMALHNTYSHSGIGKPVFPKETGPEIEALFRNGNEDAGVKRLLADIRSTFAKHHRRPMMVIRLAGALNALGEYLEERGRDEDAIEVLLESCTLSPDGVAPTRLALLAMKRKDAALAARLAEVMQGFGLDAVGDESLGEALGLDLDGFRALQAKGVSFSP